MMTEICDIKCGINLTVTAIDTMEKILFYFSGFIIVSVDRAIRDHS